MNRIYIYYTLLLISLLSSSLSAQEHALDKVKRSIDIDRLNGIREQLYQKSEINRALIKSEAIDIGVPVDSGHMALVGFDRYNSPIIYTTSNYNALFTTSTDRIMTGGDLSYNLNGSEQTVSVWDGGVAYSHSEFDKEDGSSRVVIKDDDASVYSHSTHVTGTIAANGDNVDAQGAAPTVTVDSYDWFDDNIEILLAAEQGMILSNHSYNPTTGWESIGQGYYYWYGDEDVSSSEDYRFGFYTDECNIIDEILYSAPYYLAVQSAGNDRNDVSTRNEYPTTAERDGGDDGYDCISGKAIAKNVLTVGSVADMVSSYTSPSSVSMSEFSSWGPTDDGRIKPDIVANGEEVLSTSTSNSYSIESGTSMAAASVTGSLVLIQEYSKRELGTYLTSSTLKALVIGTADECGTSYGPDYRYGWGLLNSASSVQLLNELDQSSSIIEDSYDGSTSSYWYVKAVGDEPLVVTCCWTDPAGTSPDKSLNPTDRMLINDLDIKLNDDETIYLPYILDPSNPDNVATTGDNDIDNVEQIKLLTPETDEIYRLSLSSKSLLESDSQDYSIVISGGVLVQDDDVTTGLISITPNPASEYIDVFVDSKSQSELTLYSMDGRIVRRELLDFGTKRIEVSDLSGGVYIVAVVGDGIRTTKKILIYR